MNTAVNNKIHVISDNDLDGVGCILFINWLYGDKYKVTHSILEKADPSLALKNFKFEDYKTVYITDSYVPDLYKPLVDKANVIIVDHHKDHFDQSNTYKVCKKIMMEKYSSCVKLLYDTFKDKIKFDKYRVALIHLIDDYDNYTLKLPYTQDLNSVYRLYTGNKADKFIEDFKEGFKGFTFYHKNAIAINKKNIEQEIKEAQYFIGEIEGHKTVGVVCKFAPNEVAHHAMEQYNCDICIIYNPTTQSVSFRRKKIVDTCKLNELAEKYCDGGGHEYSAGGRMTDTLMEALKEFKPIK